MQIISKDQSDAVQVSIDFNSQSLSTQGQKAEQLVSMMPAIKKSFDLLGDDIVELSTENDGVEN